MRIVSGVCIILSFPITYASKVYVFVDVCLSFCLRVCLTIRNIDKTVSTRCPLGDEAVISNIFNHKGVDIVSIQVQIILEWMPE